MVTAKVGRAMRWDATARKSKRAEAGAPRRESHWPVCAGATTKTMPGRPNYMCECEMPAGSSTHGCLDRS